MASQEAEEPAGKSFTSGSWLALQVTPLPSHSCWGFTQEGPGGAQAWSVQTAGHSPNATSCLELPPLPQLPVSFPSQSPLLRPGHPHRTKHLILWGTEADRAGLEAWLCAFLKIFLSSFEFCAYYWVTSIIAVPFIYFLIFFICNRSFYRVVKTTRYYRYGGESNSRFPLRANGLPTLCFCVCISNSSSRYPPQRPLGIL